ncbi:MAG: type II toxin-antitoxin system VapC family toxin [Leptospirales bacterium]
MKYILDTNICIYIIKKQPAAVILRLTQTPIQDIAISVITYSELEYGVSKSQHQTRNKIALMEFLAPFTILPYDEIAGEKYGEIRADLERKGTTIGNMDMLIASHTLTSDRTLVTNNEKEFNRIPDLKVENWSKS